MKTFLQGIQYFIVAICIVLMISCEISFSSRLFYLCLIIAMITNLFSDNKYIKWGGDDFKSCLHIYSHKVLLVKSID